MNLISKRLRRAGNCSSRSGARAGHEHNYFDLAALLRPELDKNEGLIVSYKSLARRELVLSHSLWTNEESLMQWRGNTKYKAAQRAEREHHFSDNRLCIATLVAEWLRQGTGNVAKGPASSFAEVPTRHIVAVSRTAQPASRATLARALARALAQARARPPEGLPKFVASSPTAAPARCHGRLFDRQVARRQPPLRHP
jgi:heme-degrading monooxygenase HmoA